VAGSTVFVDGNNRVNVFSGPGTFSDAFGWGVVDGQNQLETCTTTCFAGLDGSGRSRR
jgi:hypothetical protein